MLGLKAVLLALWFELDTTVALIFLTVLGTILGRVKFEDFKIGLLGKPNLARLASKGDALAVVVSSGTVSVVTTELGASVEIVVGDCVLTVVDESKSMMGLEGVSVVVVVVEVVDGMSDDKVDGGAAVEGEAVVLSVV